MADGALCRLLRQFALLVVLLVDPGVNQQRDGQDASYYAQRDGDRDMVEVDDQHLHANKHQDHRQTVFEHREALGDPRQQEVHGAQAEDREQV